MRRHNRTAAAALLVAGLLLTACTSGSSSDDGEPADPAPATSSSPAAKNDEAVEPSPAADKPHPLGHESQWAESAGGLQASGTATALAYKQPITGITGTGQDGEEWAQIEAQVCVTKTDTPISVSQFPWSLAFGDGTRVEVTGSSGGDFPRPEYPMDAVVKPGDCAKGLIMFPVPTGERPERIVYQPTGGTSAYEWTVPAK